MISKTHQTIFVHIPKVAGQSIETMFLNDLKLNWSQRDELLLRRKKLFEKGPLRLAHLKAHQYVDLNYINQKSFNEYFKFSFVRNPYSRAYSHYKYLGYSKVCTFEFFVLNILKKKLKQNHFFFISQTDYLYNSNEELLVDFVGKFENLEQDIKHVIDKANLKTKALPFVNKSKNEIKRGISKVIKNPLTLANLKLDNEVFKDYRDAYNEKTIEAVGKLYSNDLKNFQYAFDSN